MYGIGDLILYGRTGICRVEELKQIDGSYYYILRPLYQKCSITTPVENQFVFSRPIITRDEAKELIEKMPSVEAQPYYNRNLNQLREHYKAWIECHSCIELIAMVKSLYLKRQEAEAQKHKFGAVDSRFMREAEDLLFGEFAAALDMERAEIEPYIASRLGAVSE